MLARAVAAIAFALAAAFARAGDFTDLWWNAQESGWGANIVQQQDVAFVTLFVYGPDGAPTWYVAPDARIYAYGSGGPHFSGTLYRTRGPWHGGPFDPAAVQAQPVGELAIEPLSKRDLRIHYTAEGVTAVKTLSRQTWRHSDLSGFFLAAFNLRYAATPGGPPYGARRYSSDMLLFVEAGHGALRTEEEGGRTCDYQGPYSQQGKFGSFSGGYSCTGGEQGTFEVSELEQTANGLSGSLRTSSPSGHASGRFSATR